MRHQPIRPCCGRLFWCETSPHDPIPRRSRIITKSVVYSGMPVNVKNSLAVNRVAIAGGVLGLVPVWGLALAPWWAEGALAAAGRGYLLNYAALILTFVGAIWWGIAVSLPQAALGAGKRSILFAWSLCPCLLVWFLLMINAKAALLGMAGLLLLQLLLDFMLLWRAQLIPRWFWNLRIALSLGAVPALVFAAFSL